MTLVQPFYGTGRRKTASARVFIRPSQTRQGDILINQKKAVDYFPEMDAYRTICEPLTALGLENVFDIYVTVQGGGKSGQKGAVRLGLAKAIVALEKSGGTVPSLQVDANAVDENVDEQSVAPLSLQRRLRKMGKLTTTDTRQVERKKYGLHKARKRAQYRKR